VHQVVGVMMGAWFLATAYSELLATQLAKLAAIEVPAGETVEVSAALAGYTELFSFLLYVGIGIGVFMLCISPWLKKRMHGVH
jgi:POT family proton-dependent oligopeptide transporter